MRIKSKPGWQKVFLKYVGMGYPLTVSARYAMVGMDKISHTRRVDPDFRAEMDAASECGSPTKMASW